MSWWLFLPLAWIATGSNLVVAQDLAWRHHAPDFLLLLLSFVIVRPSVPRRLGQALCLGLLMDFSGTGQAGIQTASAVLTVALLSRWTRTEADDSASWLLWAFPAMSLCLCLSIAGFSLWGNVSLLSVNSMGGSLLVSAVTMVWGVVLCVLMALFKRLTRGKDRGLTREPHSLSFFLAR